MKALSIRQPWCWLILHAGKDIENREWGDNYPGLRDARALVTNGEPFLIHAAKGMTRDEYGEAMDFACGGYQAGMPALNQPMPGFADLQRGGIVGQARLSEIVRRSKSPWFFGPIGLVLTDVKPLPFRAVKGALGFFEVADG